MYKNYIGISRDHSGSMYSIGKAAMKDYNQTVDSLKRAATEENIDTIMSVVECGYAHTAQVRAVVTNSSIVAVNPISTYSTDGRGTPLFDSVGDLIEMFQAVPDATDENVSFVIMVITDGEENASFKWRSLLAGKIKQLQSTDRWTFVFRVPKGNKNALVRMGIPAGNILEWETTERGMVESTRVTQDSFRSFYSARSSGLKSTTSFFTTNLTEVEIQQVKASLIDVSSQVQFWVVDGQHANAQIRDFCEAKSGANMLKGAAFYQLIKKEKEVQDYKLIGIKDIHSGAVYVGPAARDLLGLPHSGTIALQPGDHADYDVFIQSTSINRKLLEGSTVMYWPQVGQHYIKGRSA